MLELALIAARKGSLGLPGKNVRALGGQPLIAWTVAAALGSRCFARVVVSTDCDEIAAASLAAGAEVPFARPPELATATATSVDVVGHALNELAVEGDFALLQPTSPFRTAHHIEGAVALFRERRASAVISITAAKPPHWLLVMDRGGTLSRALPTLGEIRRRQDALRTVQPNGAIYLTSAATFRLEASFMPPHALGYEMGVLDSIDIDEPEDFTLAEAIVAAGLRSFPA